MRQVTLLLRLEGFVALAAAVAAYTAVGGGWILFLLLILAPDLFMLGYLVDERRGATVYNLGHTYAVPLALIALGYLRGIPLPVELGLIWIAHIGLDRMLGFGLKLPTGFRDTHLTSAEGR